MLEDIAWELPIAALLAVLGLALAAYAQVRVGVHAGSAVSVWGLRIFLALVGLGLGYVASFSFGYAGELVSLLAFLAGFGFAHLPAAGVLFIKAQRGEYG